MKRTVLTLAFPILLAAASGAASAEEAGRVMLNGREVILQSDGTWAYSDTAASAPSSAIGCTSGQTVVSKKLPVSFCLPQGWRMMANPSDTMEYEAIQSDKDIYVGLITERTTMTEAAVRDAILYNAATAAGTKQSDVPVILEEKRKLSGEDWNYIVYDVNFTGATFRFGNYYRALGDKGVIQLVFWSSKSYFDEEKKERDAIVDTLALKQ